MSETSLVFPTHSVIKHPKKKNLEDQMGEPQTKSYQLGVYAVICVSFGVLGMKRLQNNWSSLYNIHK